MKQEKNIEKIIDLMRTDDSVDAPKDVVKWAKNLYLTRGPKPSLVRRISAILKMDLAQGGIVFGERSGAPARTRQMLFQAGDNAIDLRVTESKKKVSIKGQILGKGFENATITLSGEPGRYEAKATASAMFELSNLPCGSFGLIAAGDAVEITIERIDLR